MPGIAPRGDADMLELARFRRLATLTIFATLALILIGGIVRVSDSGLGCGAEGSGTHGWPLCEGGVLPADSAESVVEFSHRVAATVVVLLIGLMAFRAFRRLRAYRPLVRGTVGAGALVLAQAALGGLTVEKGLEDELVAAHLGLAMLLLGLLLYLRRASDPATEQPAPGTARGLRPLTFVTAGLVLATIVAGGYVAGTEYHGTPDQPLVGCARGLRAGLQHGSVPGLQRAGLPLLRPVAPRRHPADAPAVHVPGRDLGARDGRAGAAPAGDLARLLDRAADPGRPDRARRDQRVGRQARRADHRAPGPGHDPVGDGGLRGLEPAAGGRAGGPGRERSASGRRGRGGDGLMESATTTRRPVDGLDGLDGQLEQGAPALHLGSRAGRRALADVARDYIALTKPRIISLLLLTTVATMIVADPSGPGIATVLWTMLGGYLAAGGAGAINHYIDRDRDARMARTRGRPLVSGRIRPLHGLIFGIVLGAAATIQLALTVNALAAALALCGLLGYVFVYTVWLKPLTPENIVIGGAAGAVPPLVGWAAATGGLSIEALYPVRDRLPVDATALLGAVAADQGRVRADRRADAARRQGRGGHPAANRRLQPRPRRLHAAACGDGFLGAIYAVAAAGLGLGFIVLAVRLQRAPSRALALRLYLSSLAYLALLFCAMAVDRVI